MEIKSIKYSDIPPGVISEGKKKNLIFPTKENANYFGGYKDKTFICLICLVINKSGTGSIKSNFTVEEHRGRGYFSVLNKHCLGYARDHNVKSILLNCLDDSVDIHLKQGARIWKKTKKISWMIYDEGY